MRYTETLPAPDLRRHVRCYWRMRAAAAERVERIVPDGCPEIVINLGDPFRRVLDDGGAREQDACLVVGQLRTSLLTLPGGSVDLFGVRFEPAGLRALLGCTVRELADVDAPLGQVCTVTHRRLIDAALASPARQRVARLDALLRDMILDRRVERKPRHALTVDAARWIDRAGSPSVGAVALAHGVSGRTLERAFDEEIGIGPKEYIRIRRLQRVIGALDADTRRPNWAGLALRCGYCDQSHLVRDFGLIAGVTPEAFVRERTALMGAFTGA